MRFAVVAGVEGREARLPLSGRTVVIDPGHRLGNRNVPR